MIEIKEIHMILSSLETRLQKVEKLFEGRLLDHERRIKKTICTELIKLEKPVLPLICRIKILWYKFKQLFGHPSSK